MFLALFVTFCSKIAMAFTTKKGNVYHLINQIIKKKLAPTKKKKYLEKKKGASMWNQTLKHEVWTQILV